MPDAKALAGDTLMHLFTCAGPTSEIGRIEPCIRTPLGNVRLLARTGEHEITLHAPVETLQIPNGGTISVWHDATAHAELLLCRPEYALNYPNRKGDSEEDRWHVDDCWAGMWRVGMLDDVPECLFSAAWEPGYRWLDGGLDPGEGLAAYIWNDASREVAIGTEDEKWLGGRAAHGGWLPQRIHGLLRHHPEVNKYETTELSTWLPALHQGELVQIHFVVAWGANNEHSTDLWLAVDCDPSIILRSASCT